MSYGEHESISQFPMPSFWQSSSVDHLNTATASALCILVDLVGGASTPYFYVKHFMHAHFVNDVRAYEHTYKQNIKPSEYILLWLAPME